MGAAGSVGGRRPRRSGDEVRRLLIVAARELFSEKGYSETTTREIIKRAGVSDQSLFSHFESKQGLFEAAMLEPLGQFIRSYVDAGSAGLEDTGSEEMLRRYVEGLFDLVVANHQVFLALSPEHLQREPAHGIIAEIEGFSARFAFAHRLDFDPVFASRAVLSLVVCMALFHDYLLPGYDRSSIVGQLTSVLLAGLLNQGP
jgi:AcrR family transcriptional regulator